MTRARQLRFHVVKEIRGLSLPWLACVVTMVGSAVFGAGNFRVVGIGAYFLGAAALGALSIGHEYSHRTLAALLSHPVRRERLLLVKAGVLAGMLLTLYAVARVFLFDPNISVSEFGPNEPVERMAALWLPVLCGLFVAPWLTMLCRTSIAGTVFILSIPGIVLIVGGVLGFATYGHSTEADSFRVAFFWRALLALCAIGAVMSWRMFMRLEAIDGRGQEVRLPGWLRRQPAVDTAAPAITRRHPIWLLAKKELRLQPMTLAVAGLYLLGWVAVLSLRHRVPDLMKVFEVLTIFYSGMVSLLIGSLASADERQFGTLGWQMLLPLSTSKQWAVKVGMALGLALLLALGLPALLMYIAEPTAANIPWLEQFLRFAVPIILLTVGSLYVSSLSSSGLRASLVSLAALFGAALFVSLVVNWVGSAVFVAVSRLSGAAPLLSVWRVDLFFSPVLALLLGAGLLAVVLRFALANHRSGDRTAGSVWTQVLWMAGCLTLSVTVLAAVAAI